MSQVIFSRKHIYKVPYIVPLPNNMGVVRYVLAMAVLLAHFQTLAGYEFHLPISSYSAVGGFFALSGFLIYGSYLRKPDMKRYLLSRARRIMPAYWITVLLFAFALCTVSSLSVEEYFSSGTFWRYLVSNMAFLNFLQPDLPGVFDGSDFYMSAVNGSLWTMKIEWCLYLTPPLVVWLVRRLRARPEWMFSVIYLLACAYRIFFQHLYEETGVEIYEILSRQFLGQLSYFYTGVICYYRLGDIMRHKWVVIGLACIILVSCDYIPFGDIVLQPLALSVCVIWVSMVGKWGTWEGKHDNISYNIYLLHFPVIQLFVYYRGADTIGLTPALLICIGTTVILAWIVGILERCIRRLW